MELGLAAGFGAGVAAVAALATRWWAARAARRAAGAPAILAEAGDTPPAAARRRALLAPGVVVLACLLVAGQPLPALDRRASPPTASPATRRSRSTGVEAAAALDAGGHDTRVLELPGSDFAAYRWGDIVDPLTPGLIDRPYLARELIPNGEPASAALLLALDRRYPGGRRPSPRRSSPWPACSAWATWSSATTSSTSASTRPART